jgi:hypothetical protein
MKKVYMLLAAVLFMVITGCSQPDNGSSSSTPILPLPPLSTAKAITAFSLAGAIGTINETGKTIAVSNMPFGTDVKALVATFTTTGVSVEVGSTIQISGSTPNDFTAPVAYIVTAANSSSVAYTVTVTVAAPTALIVNDNLNDPTRVTALTTLTNIMTTAGMTITTNIGVPAGDLSGYTQIWDIRYDNRALTAGEITSYETYVAGGGILVMIGENTTGFLTRDNSIISLISTLGGGNITLVTPLDLQTVESPFTGPNTVTSVTYELAAGTANPGTGVFITKDTNGDGSAIFYGLGTLSNATAGRLIVVFDINFLDSSAPDYVDYEKLTANILSLN